MGQDGFIYNLKNTPNIKLIEKEIDSIIFQTNLTESEIIKKAFKFSRIYYKQNNLKTAIKYAKIQNKYSKKFNIYNKHYHTSYYLIGKYYMLENQLDSAIANYKKALELNYYPKKVAQSFCQLAQCYRMRGELHKSLEYYVKGIDLLLAYQNKNSILSHGVNISLTCNQIKTKESALIGIKYLQKCDSIIKNNDFLKDRVERCILYNNLGNLYQIPQNYNFLKAKHNYIKAIEVSSIQTNNYVYTHALLNLGELYIERNIDSSFYYLNKSLKHSNEVSNFDKQAFISEIFRNLSNYYIKKDKAPKALEQINNSLKSGFEIPLEDTLTIKHGHFEKVISRRNIVLAFKGKAEILNLLYNKTKYIQYLRESIETINTCDAFVNYTIQNSTEINTKFLWRDDVSEIYNYGVLAAYNFSDYELLNSIIEKNKAFLLTQSIKENNNHLSLPYQVKNKLKNYKNEILSLEEKSNTKKLKDSLFNKKLEFDRFKDSITSIYPEFFSKKNNIQPLALEKTKSNLDSKSVILSFHLDRNNNNLFGLFTSKTGNYSFKKEIDSVFYKLVDNYKKLISKPLTKKSELKEFYATSNSLYNYLFSTQESKQFIENKNIIVIANDILQNIPFESLNTNAENGKYLIEDHDISYAYSASFLDFNNSIKRKTSKNLAAYAPVSFANQKALEATADEVNKISNEIKSDLFTTTNATKNNFLSNSGNYKILHLATHATSSNNPAIYFSKDTLKLHELYTHKTNADLVVLSACETNLGEIKKGEGVFSLSRGFFYSGAKSVISSLWNVNDVSTSSIMKDFYKNLNNHQSKSKALNNAKRKYLKEHSLSEKSPYYWASFVLIGDTSPTYPATPYLLYLLGFAVLFSIILFFFKKRG